MGLDNLKRFIVDGSYIELIQEKERLRILKNLIRKEQESLDLKRCVWAKYGVVGKFQISKIYDYNHEELNLLLFNVGILPLVTFIKSDDLTEEELNRIAPVPSQRRSYLRFTPSKTFKQHEKIPLFDLNVEVSNLLAKVAMWKDSYKRFERLNTIWQREKSRALDSPELNTLKRLVFDCGTFTLLEGPKKYRTDMVFGLLDDKTIINFAKINFDRMDEIRARGFLNKYELNSVRRVVDVQRRYLLMTIQNEKLKKDYWHSKLERLSRLSQRSIDG